MAARQGLAGSFWPSEEQNLLLQAALLADEPGEQAWRLLKPHFDVQRFESGSLGLLSLLNERRGREEPFLARLTGVRRFIWYGNHTGFEALRAALEPLRRRGLPALVLRDAALIERYYRRLGVRPLVEPALLVRPENLPAATETLVAAGWRAGVRAGRSQRFEREPPDDGRACVIYWRFAPELESAGGYRGDSFWAAARDAEAQYLDMSALSPTDELFTTCIVGARTRSSTDFQWIVDAVTILETSAAEIDWDRLLAEAQIRRCVPRLRDALVYLSDALAAPVPAEVLRRLVAMPDNRRERLAHRISGRGGRLLGNLPATVAAHVVATQDQNALRAAASLPRFLRAEWGLDHLGQLPAAAARRGAAALSAARARRHAST